MNDIQSHFVKNMLRGVKTAVKESGSAFAPSNIALCKYWGKRDTALNLPVNSSLSVSLGTLGSRTGIRVTEGQGGVYLNGIQQAMSSGFAQRIARFLDHFQSNLGNLTLEIRTENNIPTAAGLASSASGFAALVKALNDLAGWNLDERRLSMLARLGSGSASRSVFDGFVQWNAGMLEDGSDSFAERIDEIWPDFRIGILELSNAEKPVGSRDGMNRTVETSRLYRSWPEQADTDLRSIRQAIVTKDFSLLGRTAECNALSMHATMLAAWPPLIYMRPESVEQIHRIHQARADGLQVYLTMDAGPNIKLLYTEQDESGVLQLFPDLQVIAPFD